MVDFLLLLVLASYKKAPMDIFGKDSTEVRQKNQVVAGGGRHPNREAKLLHQIGH